MATPLGLVVMNDVMGDDSRLVIDNFEQSGPSALGTSWSGFSDRVMGGMSEGRLDRTKLDGESCIRLQGFVTRKNNGGFLQMALPLSARRGDFDASAYRGIELLVLGNDESYNVHLRTADVTWYDQSYRATFFAPSTWQRLRLPWAAFKPHGLDTPLNTRGLRRIGLLGWMREFKVDLALGEIALYA